MLIITADDYGKNQKSTNAILRCFELKKISCASAMVMMEDSLRAAHLAVETGMEIGLHLNFTELFTSTDLDSNIRRHQLKTVSYLRSNRVAQAIYNPVLVNAFKELFYAQLDEFYKLYRKEPIFYNGHHHMHLCANVLLSKLIPKGSCVRTTFSFSIKQKSPLNRLYRRLLSFIVASRFTTTDAFYSILPLNNISRLSKVISQSLKNHIELETHPEKVEELEFLLSDRFGDIIEKAHTGSFSDIRKREGSQHEISKPNPTRK